MDDAAPLPALLRHEAFVRAVARAALGGDDGLDDVVQEVGLSVLGSATAAPRNPLAWLSVLARRRAADHQRRETARRRHEQVAARGAARHSATPEEILAREESRRALVEELLSLDAPSRQVLLLRYEDDLPPRAIAGRLALPVETVRTRLRRALARLRERLDRRHQGRRSAWAAPLSALVGALPAPSLAGGAPLAPVAALALALVAGGWWLVAREHHERRREAPDASRTSAGPTLEGRSPAARAQAAGAQVGSLRGWVRLDGAPTAALVTLRPGAGTGVGLAPPLSATADADGAYVLPDVPVGTHDVTARLRDGTEATLHGVELPLPGAEVAADLHLRSGAVTLSGVVLEPDGAPAQAWVRASTRSPGGEDGGTVGPEVASGPDGRFALARLPEGRLELSARRRDGRGHAWLEVLAPTQAPVRLVLRDPGDASVPPGRVQGRVLDPQGRPVAGVAVHAHLMESLDAEGGVERSVLARTDGAGRFAFPPLGAGFVRLVVHDQGWTLPGLDASVEGGGDPLRHATDAQGRLTCELHAVVGAGVAGTLRDEEGAPVPGALLRLDVDPDEGLDAPPVLAVSAEDGSFRLAPTLAGVRARVSARSPRLLAEVEASLEIPAASEPGPGASEAPRLELVGRRLDPARWLDLTLEAEGSGQPLAGVPVRLTSPGGPPGEAVAGRLLRTDPRGRARLGPLPRGPLTLEAWPPLLAPPRTPPWRLEVRPGAVRVAVPVAAGITGRVRLPPGRGAFFVRVRAEPLPPGAGAGAEARVDDDGTFALGPLGPGRFRVHARDDVTEPALEAEGEAETGEGGVRLDLQPVAAGSGGGSEPGPEARPTLWSLAVVDAAGRPVPRATLLRQHADGGLRRIEISGGAHAYRYAGPPTRSWFGVTHARGADGAPLPLGPALVGPLDLSGPGGPLRLVLPAERRLEGRVLDDGGAPVAGAIVSARSRGSGDGAGPQTPAPPHARTITDAEGRFALGRLGDQEYDLEVSPPRGFLVPPGPVARARGGAGELTLRLRPAPTFLVRVLQADGSPADRALVRVVRPAGHGDDEDVERRVSDPTGAARLTRLRGAGPFALLVRAADSPQGPDPVPLRVEPWTPADTTVRLAQSFRVSGQVVDEDGRPLAGARVRADGGPQALTDDDGRFELRGLPAAPLRLVAQDGYAPPGAPVECAAGATGVRLQAARGSEFRVHVEGHDGERCEVEWRAHDAAGRPVGGGSESLETDGRVLARQRFPAGTTLTLRVRARRAGRVAAARDLPLERPFGLRLEAGLVVRGRVEGAEGVAPERLRVVGWLPGSVRVEGAAQADGSYVVPALLPGERVRVRIEATLERGATLVGEALDVPAGAEADLRLHPR